MKRITNRLLRFLEKLPIYSITTLLIGVWLLVFPENALQTALRISGTVLLVYALYRFVAVFVLDTDVFERPSSLFSTVINLVLGMLLIVNPLFVAGIISTMFGVYLIISGAFGLWRAAVVKENYELFGIVEDRHTRRKRAIMAIVSLTIGLVMIIFPLAAEKLTTAVTGICLITEGARSIIVKAIEHLSAPRTKEKKDIEADFIDKSDTL